ncbi:hypothetical protein [Altererythrobacter sp. Root672]|uniref:hypothetical protein n=1 Tax=Altererythrobacter sp. Root672 TaxID=1736584 RepID=UPI000AF47E5B|nr:hypothetical protein [Altererythrobacter sp. Root672]
MQRTPKAEEAILLARSAEEVRDYLRQRAAGASLFDPIGQDAEAALLARRERLIDLSLAEYCLHRETARELFERGSDDWPLRALVLSNQALAKSQILGRFPLCLFEDEDALLSYLETISPDDQWVLFSNPALDESFLEGFLSMDQTWEAIDSEQRLWVLDALAGNAKLQKIRSTQDHEDGWGWYMAGKPFEAAWLLIEKLEPGTETARHLAKLLRDLPADSYKTDGIAEALVRWRAIGEDALADETNRNAEGRLSDFQEVRQAAARLLAGRHDAKPRLFIDSDDVALRCGAYEAASKLDEETLEAAVKLDGDLARLHLIRNEGLWRSEKSRDLLLDVVLRGSEGDEPRWEYRRRERHYRKEYPTWFEGEEYLEPDERPISESSIADVVASVTGDPAIKGIQRRLDAVEDRQRSVVWLAALCLIMLAVLVWRT